MVIRGAQPSDVQGVGGTRRFKLQGRSAPSWLGHIPWYSLLSPLTDVRPRRTKRFSCQRLVEPASWIQHMRPSVVLEHSRTPRHCPVLRRALNGYCALCYSRALGHRAWTVRLHQALTQGVAHQALIGALHQASIGCSINRIYTPW